MHATTFSNENHMCSSASITNLVAVSVSISMLFFKSLMSAKSFHTFSITGLIIVIFLRSHMFVIVCFRSLDIFTWCSVVIFSLSVLVAINKSAIEAPSAQKFAM